MAQDKKVFTGGMDKDSDPRLIKQGDYRDALNIRTVSSSDSTAGSVENIEGNMIYELYFLQDYLELKGAKVRFFDHPFSDWGIQTTNQSHSFKTGYREWFGKSYEKFATELPDLPAVFNKLNLMDLSDFYNKDENYENEGTLHFEGLKKDDAHYSETGNERLAKVIFKRLDKKYSKRIFATLPGVWDLTRNKKKLI